ncbi:MULTISPECIES: hypothetical protein [unclassified Mesorhizobium]|uniref:hypothetical protein n=1 Tax=unclassified Mesorhizobium TaxID=325217 RepID=UPI0015E34919|nr:MULTISPECIES: hypothetical protein [unclassified Mesorhizobium]
MVSLHYGVAVGAGFAIVHAFARLIRTGACRGFSISRDLSARLTVMALGPFAEPTVSALEHVQGPQAAEANIHVMSKPRLDAGGHTLPVLRACAPA